MYAVGMALSQQVMSLELTKEELEIVHEGLQDGVFKKDAKIEMQTYGPKIQSWAQARLEKLSNNTKIQGDDYISDFAKNKNVIKTKSGVLVKFIKKGKGDFPTIGDTVKVHYHGTLVDGKVFDSSVSRKEPMTFPLGEVILCWKEGINKIQVGGKAKIVCPPETAYGEKGVPPMISPNTTLIFEVELIEIIKKG